MLQKNISIKRLVVGQMAEDCYLVSDTGTKETLIIDPGDDPEYISDVISREGLKPILIAATHGHFDHILGVRALQLAFNLPFLINTQDKFLVRRSSSTAKHYLGIKYADPNPQILSDLKDGDFIKIGKINLTVMSTPGHTPGSICLYGKKEKIIFVGDLVFEGGDVGRTDFIYASRGKLKESIKKILTLPGNTLVYPGHGKETRVKILKKLLSV